MLDRRALIEFLWSIATEGGVASDNPLARDLDESQIYFSSCSAPNGEYAVVTLLIGTGFSANIHLYCGEVISCSAAVDFYAPAHVRLIDPLRESWDEIDIVLSLVNSSKSPSGTLPWD